VALAQGGGGTRIPDLGWGVFGPEKKKFDPWENGPKRQLRAQIERQMGRMDRGGAFWPLKTTITIFNLLGAGSLGPATSGTTHISPLVIVTRPRDPP
jgi:hypothetical protein